MTKDNFKRRLQSEEDFIAIKRFEFSLEKLLERFPNGCSSKIIAQALLISEDELKILEEEIVTKLREKML